MRKEDTSATFNDLVDNWTERMMKLDHKITANRHSVDELEKQIDETYKEMEDIEKVAHDLLGDKAQLNLYENEDNTIRISYESDSIKEPNKSEKSCFDTNIKMTVVDEETGSWSSIEQGVIGVDEYGNPIQGLKVSVGGDNSEEEIDEGVQFQPVYGHLSRDSEENHYR